MVQSFYNIEIALRSYIALFELLSLAASSDLLNPFGLVDILRSRCAWSIKDQHSPDTMASGYEFNLETVAICN